MTMTFVIAACLFAAVLGALVAWVDRWRDSRLTLVRPAQRVPVAVSRGAAGVSSRKRAA
jgi:hypothetical protein